MREHVSIFMLMVRRSFWRIFALIAVLAAAQAGLFYLFVQKAIAADIRSLEYVVESSRISWVFAACFLLVTALLTFGSHEISGTYTARRLCLSPHWVYVWQSVYNVLCYLLLWLMEILLVIVLCYWYTTLMPAEAVSVNTVFLAFYRSGFLHSLLPFEESVFWAQNIIMVLALGICAARHPKRNEKTSRMQLGMLFTVLAFFGRDLGDFISCIFAIGLSLTMAGYAIYQLFGEED